MRRPRLVAYVLVALVFALSGLSPLAASGTGLGTGQSVGGTLAIVPYEARYALIRSGGEVSSGILRAAGDLQVAVRESCAGWQQSQRLLLTITRSGGERASLVKEFEAAEAADRNSFAFSETTSVDGRVIDRRTGNAQRFPGGAVIVDLAEPSPESFGLDPSTTFLFSHLDRIVRRAAAGQSIDRSMVFDGTLSEALDIVTEIGASTPLDIYGPEARTFLGAGIVWPIKQLGFRAGQGGDPLYRFDMRLHESGIAVELEIDLIDFSLRGDLIEGRLLPRAAC